MVDAARKVSRTTQGSRRVTSSRVSSRYQLSERAIGKDKLARPALSLLLQAFSVLGPIFINSVAS